MKNESLQAREADGFAPATTRADSRHADGTLIDRWGRHINYIRLSVTDRCNFRCSYCMPLKVKFLPKREVLSLEECLRVARVFSQLGARKVRITGGEPLARRDVVWLCRQIAALPEIREVVMTTNGSQLPRMAAALRAAGVARLNISLDTLNAARFRRLTQVADIEPVLAGIDAALAAGFQNIKINTVLMRGFNDDELPALARYAAQRGADISFIEEMPLGTTGLDRRDTFFGCDQALGVLQEHFKMTPSDHNSGGPARYWTLDEFGTRAGFIAPHTNNFCASCNRVRITCIGELYPCLGQNDAVDLKPAIRAKDDDALRALIVKTMAIKPKGHDFDLAQHAQEAKVVRFMSATGG